MKKTALLQRPERSLKAKIPWIILALVLVTIIVVAFPVQVRADDVWDKATELFKSVYNKIVAISTVAAVVTAAVALLLMNFSRNGRTVDESRSWLKRILITWFIINSLGFIITYIAPFVSGGSTIPTT